ncbi:alpha/beta fold hydrolase [Candidatus Parabeggiatoa sp. HSG14]|uniref:alpha/beta fold hydrolase n=1 Tax=Candidatus Parabeggiatoa sp. HSG14 TaxID=3055593 RepID=UPI0025A748F1|nr:alpha/beta fold hydrolase [Thiotrichales bacterium HSG14]
MLKKIIFSIAYCCLLISSPTIADFITMSDGAKIYYEVAGQGTPLLLIHGGDTNIRRNPYSTSDFKASISWEPQFQKFAKEFKVIRFDIRGFGKSTLVGKHPIDSWAWQRRKDRTVTDVVELLKFLNIQKTHVIGLSIGAGIAAQLAVYHPKMVNKLIIASPWNDHSLSFSSQRQLTRLNKFKKRTLLIVGANDRHSIGEANAAKQRGYNPKREVIRNAGHFSNSEQPTKFNNLVLTFLRTKPTADNLYKQDNSTNYGWGKQPEQFGLQEGEEIETFGPHTYSVDSQGNMYVVDTINSKIKVLNDKGRYQRNIDFTGWASDIMTGRNNKLFILDNDSLIIQPVRGKATQHQISPDIPKVEGYGQGMRVDNAGNLYLCQFQQCYQIGVAQKNGIKILHPDEQLENVSPGYPIKDNKFVRTLWKSNHKAVIEIMDEDWAIVQTIPMKTDDVFGMVGFLRQDDKGFFYIEVERITNDNYVHLEIWQYDEKGQHVSVTELPNDYYSTVYKKAYIDESKGITQLFTTQNGVKVISYQPIPKNFVAPKKGCRAFFTGAIVGGKFVTNTVSEVYQEDTMSEYVGAGEYPNNERAFPKAVAATFDGIAIDSGTRVVIYSKKNFKGKILLDKTGPAIINNLLWKNYPRLNRYHTETYDEPLQSSFPQSVRKWSNSNMHKWSYGSLKVICK